MKKLLTLTGLSILLLLCACEKDKNVGESHLLLNRVEVIPSDGKTASTAILLCQIGHDGKNCPGCVLYHGKMRHFDCMGDGHYCASSAAVLLQQDGEFFTATTTLVFITSSWLNVMNMIDMRKWSSIYRLGKNNFLA